VSHIADDVHIKVYVCIVQNSDTYRPPLRYQLANHPVLITERNNNSIYMYVRALVSDLFSSVRFAFAVCT
jgi:hypothetical protein